MGIEDFWGKFPADSSLKPQFERIKMHRASNRSLVWLFANELVKEAGYGLREITDGINPADLDPDEGFLYLLDAEHLEIYQDSLAAAYFGVAVTDNGIGAMPPPLAEAILGSQQVPRIQGKIVPRYIERAKLLIL